MRTQFDVETAELDAILGKVFLPPGFGQGFIDGIKQSVEEGVEKFDPDQARDESGKWTSSGGGNTSPAIFRKAVSGTRKFNETFGDKHAGDLKFEAAERLARSLEKDSAFAEFAKRTAGELGDPAWVAASGLLKTWAASSSDHNPRSLALQLAANDVFGIPVTGVVRDVVEDSTEPEGVQARKDYEENGAALRAFVKTAYDHTQEDLARLGIDHMLIYRGVTQGGPVADGFYNVQMHALSSFSLSPEVALSFSESAFARESSYAMAAIIPRSQIFSHPRTGLGCLDEAEIVVIGKPTRAYITRSEMSEDLESKFTGKLVKSLDSTTQLCAVALRVNLAKFDPDQARDESGKWTSTGGGTSTSSRVTLPGGKTIRSPGSIPAGPGAEWAPRAGYREWGFVAPPGSDYDGRKLGMDHVQILAAMGYKGAEGKSYRDWLNPVYDSIKRDGLVRYVTDKEGTRNFDFGNHPDTIDTVERLIVGLPSAGDRVLLMASKVVGGPFERQWKVFAGTARDALEFLDRVRISKAAAAKQLWAAALRIDLEKFDPDQARDETGKWTATGGDGGSTGTVSAAVFDVGVHGTKKYNEIIDRADASNLKSGTCKSLADRLWENPAFVKFAKDEVGEATDVVETATSFLLRRWASTSSDHDHQALAIQHAANDVFGIPVRGLVAEAQLQDPSLGRITQSYYAEHGEALRAFVQVTYENTQKDLESLGISHVLVYRGVTQEIPTGLHDVNMHALSSFSTDVEEADYFARGAKGPGAVMAAVIPRSQIFSTPRTGLGCAGEHEVVVLGRPTRVYSTSRTGWEQLTPKFLRGVFTEKPTHKSLDGADQLLAAALRIDLTKFDPDQARDQSGKWTSGGSQASVGGGGLKLVPSGTRAFSGKRVPLKTELSKQEAGRLGEQIVIAHLKEQGYQDADRLNQKQANFPVDAIADHQVLEIKSGLASNLPGAQNWRATIGQPGKQEAEWLKTASDEDKRAWNDQKRAAILERKQKALREVSKQLGLRAKPATVGVILNPDTKTADVYRFKGFHLSIRWNSPAAQKAYVRSYKYA